MTLQGRNTMRSMLTLAFATTMLFAFADTAAAQDGVCVEVKIQIKQKLVLTRQAFQATLAIDNGTPELLENVEVCLKITDENNQPANDVFFVPSPEVVGTTGPIIQTNGCSPDTFTLGGAVPQMTTTAQWDILALDSAVPGPESKRYFIGGELRHELAGTPIVVPLFPVEVEVAPQPSLLLDYYLQSTVYSDDPFTFSIVEPIEPFNLGLRVRNVGFGDAKDLSITTSQPEIVQNDAGLEIGFQIVGAQVGTSPVTPDLESFFGDLPGGESTVARWLIESTLKGQFIDMDVTFEHLGGTGNSDLSLIDGIEIHDLFHAVELEVPLVASGLDDGLADFLVIDPAGTTSVDPSTGARLPNRLDDSMGGVETVASAWSVGGLDQNLTVTKTPAPSDLTGRFELNVGSPGWHYLRADSIDLDRYGLVLVSRTGPDGSRVSFDVGRSGDVVNAWTTIRSEDTVGGPAPDVVQRLVHVLDRPTVPGTYVYDLSFEVLPQLAFSSDIDVVSLATGGTQTLTIDAGVENAGKPFIVLGSATGTSPGFSIDGVFVPLVQDAYFDVLLSDPVTQAEFGSQGLLNGMGQATVTIIVEPNSPTFLIGEVVYHAFLLLDPVTMNVTFSSNAVPLSLQP